MKDELEDVDDEFENLFSGFFAFCSFYNWNFKKFTELMNCDSRWTKSKKRLKNRELQFLSIILWACYPVSFVRARVFVSWVETRYPIHRRRFWQLINEKASLKPV